MDNIRLEIFGNVGKEPEMRYTPSGKAVTQTSVAATVGYGENKKTEWVKIVAWEKLAELLKQLVKKGTFIWVSGTPKSTYWLNKEGEANGQIELTVREFKVLKNGADKEEEALKEGAEGTEEEFPF